MYLLLEDMMGMAVVVGVVVVVVVVPRAGQRRGESRRPRQKGWIRVSPLKKNN